MPNLKIAAAAIMLFLAVLPGCGRKGPLFMPTAAPVNSATVVEAPVVQSEVMPDPVIINPVIQSQPEATKQP